MGKRNSIDVFHSSIGCINPVVCLLCIYIDTVSTEKSARKKPDFFPGSFYKYVLILCSCIYFYKSSILCECISCIVSSNCSRMHMMKALVVS